jgi:hypothetical protein
MRHSPAVADGRADFDFIFGSWRIANRRLVDQTDPECGDWLEFATESTAYPIFDGLAHLDLITAGPDAPNGPWQGLTVRQFDPADAVWRIWWASSRNSGHLDPPLTGRFVDGVGHFEGEDEVAGRPISVRFEWLNPAPDSARWTQSFSFDGGRRWVPNWVMDFTRTSGAG